MMAGLHKTLLVARHEFRRYVTRKGFLFVVLGLPLLLIVIFVATILILTARAGDPIGVVDHSARLLDPAAYSQTIESNEPPFVAFAGEEGARAALASEEIQAYVVIPAAYPETAEVDLVHFGDASEDVYGNVSDYLRASLLQQEGVSAAAATLLAEGSLDTEFVSLREGSGQNPIVAFLFPFAAAFLILMSIFTTAGYLLQAVVDEKENRTMEILVTSLSPGQLITGKIAGLVALGLLQTAIWAGSGVAVFLIARTQWDVLQTIQLPTDILIITLLWFLPFYLMMACFMAAIGLSVTEVSEGQQASSIVTMMAAAPLWFAPALVTIPNSPLAVGLSLFPFSAPLAILVRWSLTDIPTWQLVLSWLILAASAAFSLWMVGRLLHFGMLRYGQRLSLREVARALRRHSLAP